MNVMIDEPVRIDVVKGSLDEVGSFATQICGQLIRLSFEGAADGMNETHSGSIAA